MDSTVKTSTYRGPTQLSPLVGVGTFDTGSSAPLFHKSPDPWEGRGTCSAPKQEVPPPFFWVAKEETYLVLL